MVRREAKRVGSCGAEAFMLRRINGEVRSGVTSGCQREENGQKWTL